MKRIVLSILSLVMAFVAMANPVGVEQARKVGASWLSSRGHYGAVKLAVVESPFADIYVFNADGGGFVIVAADDCARPILGYSLTGSFRVEQMPANVRSWLKDYGHEIGETKAVKQGSRGNANEWRLLSAGTVPEQPLTTAVSPLLTTTWDQSPLYNNMCPYDSVYGQRVVTGCVATATAQIMKYWNHPATGYGSHSYEAQNDHISYGVLSADFGATNYAWDIMPNALTSVSSAAEIDAVALLMQHVGIAVEMHYNVSSQNGSGAYNHSDYYPSSMSALVEYFKYAPDIVVVAPGNYNNITYSAILRAELDQRRPILYDGRDENGGHSFVCDGYDESGYFHFNWGWGGYCDGYYALGALNPSPGGTGGNATYTFNMSNSAMLRIRPNTNFGVGGTVTVNIVGGDSACAVTGAGTYSFGDTVTLAATAPEGYRFAGWSDNSSANPRMFIMTGGDYNFTARFESISGDTMSYCGNMPHTNYWGEYDQNIDKYWGIKLPASSLAQGRTLSAIEFYVGSSYYYGTFDITVYSGTTAPTDTVYSTTVTSGYSDINSWYSIFLPTPYTVEADKSIWITFHNNDIQFPATITSSSGNPDGFLYGEDFNPNPRWTHFSFMIRGRFDNPSVIVDGDTVSYCGDKSFQTCWDMDEWGIMLPAAELQGRNYLKSVKMYSVFDNIYTLHVYKGGATAPGTLVHSQPALIEGYGWHEIVLDDTVAINAGDSLWITLENHEQPWPATSCRYTGNPNSNWMTVDGSSWTRLDEYYNDGSSSWMIKAVTSDTLPTPSAPTVVIKGDQLVTVGNTAMFSAVHSTATTVTWSLQAGTPSTATGDTVYVTWNQTGWYQVTATVSNNNGTTTDEMMVSVGDCDSIVLPYTADFTQCWTAENGATIIDDNHASIISNGQKLTSPWLESLPGRTFLTFRGEVDENFDWNSNAEFMIRIEDEYGELSSWSYLVQNIMVKPSFISPGGRIRVVFEYIGNNTASSFQISNVSVFQYQIDVTLDVPNIVTVGDTVTLTLNATLQNGDTADVYRAWSYDISSRQRYYNLLPYYEGDGYDITVLSQTENSVTMVYNNPGRFRIGAEADKNDVYNGAWAWADVYQDIIVTARPIYVVDSIYYTSSAKDTVIGCHSQLHTANIADEARVILDSAFFDLANLTVINMPEGLERIGYMAFAWNYNIRELTIPRGMKYIGDNAFWYCPNLTTVNFNADSCIEMCRGWIGGDFYPVFIECYSLSTVNIGENVKRIPDFAFSNCNSLRGTLVIPDEVKYVGKRAFFHYVNYWTEDDTLQVVIGSSVQEIGDTCFPRTYYNQKLASVISRAQIPPIIHPATFFLNPDLVSLTVPCGAIPDYQAAYWWYEFTNIHDNCTSIDDMEYADMPRIYGVSQGIVVVGANGERVTIYDMLGRHMTSSSSHLSPFTIHLPSGVYLVRVGDRPARKVVVLQ